MTEIIGTPMPYNIPRVWVKNIMAEQNPQKDIGQSGTTNDSQKLSDIRVEKKNLNTDGKDISLTFNKEDAFDYIGKDSGLGNLDIERAISDMHRDKVLEEYQYFVGGKPDLEDDGDIDGTVIIK